MNQFIVTNKPSVYFCKTGCLSYGEKYNKDLHSISLTIRGRAQAFYTESEIVVMEQGKRESVFAKPVINHPSYLTGNSATYIFHTLHKGALSAIIKHRIQHEKSRLQVVPIE